MNGRPRSAALRFGRDAKIFCHAPAQRVVDVSTHGGEV